jgi:hypothetical protein
MTHLIFDFGDRFKDSMNENNPIKKVPSHNLNFKYYNCLFCGISKFFL